MQASFLDDFGIDAYDPGHADIRLDQSYGEFYMDQVSRSSNLNLPVPLDATTLFSNFARQILSEHVQGRPLPTLSPNPQVQQMFESLVNGASSIAYSPLNFIAYGRGTDVLHRQHVRLHREGGFVHERRVQVPALAALRSQPQELALADPAQLERYWKTLASSGLAMTA